MGLLDDFYEDFFLAKERLLARVARGWSRHTAVAPDKWAADNPATGQCAVTALVVQDLLGGEIARVAGTAETGSHYFNEIPPKFLHEADPPYELDLTRSQFSASQAEFLSGQPRERRTREYLLSSEDTRLRYVLLCGALDLRARL